MTGWLSANLVSLASVQCRSGLCASVARGAADSATNPAAPSLAM
jgi:hypothetical protein